MEKLLTPRKKVDSPPENPILGKNSEEIHSDNAQQQATLSLDLCQQAQHTIRIYSQDLDRATLDNQDLQIALSRFVRQSPRAKVQILIIDSTRAVQTGHMLIRLARQLSSYVEIRKVNPLYGKLDSHFISIDGTAFIYREQAQNWHACINYNSPTQSRRLDEYFDRAWQSGESDPNIRSFII